MSDTESSELEQLKKNHQSIRMMINEIYKAINDGINGYLLNNRYYELEKKIIDYLLEYQSVKTKYEGHNKSIFDVERYRLYNDSESKHKMAKIKEVMNEIKAKLKGIKVENFKVQKPLVAESSQDSKSSIKSVETSINQISLDALLTQIRMIEPFTGKFLEFQKFFESITTLLDNCELIPSLKIEILKEKLNQQNVRMIESVCDDNDYEEMKNVLRKKYYDPFEVEHHLVKSLNRISRMNGDLDLNGLEILLRESKNAAKLIEKTDLTNADIHPIKRTIFTKLSRSIIGNLNSSNIESTTLEEMINVSVREYELLHEYYKVRNLIVDEDTVPPPSSSSLLGQRFFNTFQYCYFCQKRSQNSSDCRLPMAHGKRKSIIFRNKLCLRCLRPGHQIKMCDSLNRCQFCNSNHHEFVCREGSTEFEGDDQDNEDDVLEINTVQIYSRQSGPFTKVEINGQELMIMVVSGAGINFITPGYVKKLNLKEEYGITELQTIGSNIIRSTRKCKTMVKFDGINEEITFFVIDNPRREKIAFGMNAIRKLKIVIITTGSNNWIVVSQDTHSKMRNDS